MTPVFSSLSEIRRERAKALQAYLQAQDRVAALYCELGAAQGQANQKSAELRAIDERMYALEHPGED